MSLLVGSNPTLSAMSLSFILGEKRMRAKRMPFFIFIVYPGAFVLLMSAVHLAVFRTLPDNIFLVQVILVSGVIGSVPVSTGRISLTAEGRPV